MGTRQRHGGHSANLLGPCGQVGPDAKGASCGRCEMQRTKPSQHRDPRYCEAVQGPQHHPCTVPRGGQLVREAEQSPKDELSESLSVFDVDGEGWVPMSHFKHLICSPESGEGLTSDQFDNLLSTVKTSEDGLVRIADIVHLLESL